MPMLGALTEWIGLRLARRRLKGLYASLGAIGRNVRIGPDAIVHFPERVRLGSNVLVHNGAHFDAEGGIEIGDNFVSAEGLTILTSNHRYEGDALPWDEEKVLRKVVVGENVWCGRRVMILPGVTIGEGAIVGAGAVVTKDVEPLSIVGGNPARVIKRRDAERYHALKKGGRFRQHPVTPLTNDRVLPKR